MCGPRSPSNGAGRRTIEDLARTSELSEDEVRGILEEYPHLVRKAYWQPGKEDLYTLKSR